jgi:hypothetical protein
MSFHGANGGRIGSVVVSVAISFVLGASFVSASAENVTADILACINKNTGSVRISQTCSPRETPFQWLINGLTGKQGPRGAQILTGKSILEAESKLIGEVGDYFLSSNDATLYGPKTSKGWPSSGAKLQGPIGPPGPVGLQGPGGSGPQGPAGYFQVYDSVGTKLGPLVMADAYGRWVVLRNGIPIPYSPTFGNVVDNGDGGYFLNSSCTGPVYFRMSRLGDPDGETSAANDWRGISRFSNSDPLFIARIVSGRRVGTNLTVPVGPNAFIESAAGYYLIPTDEYSTTWACIRVASPNLMFRYFELKASIHPSVQDAIGPLTIREN